MITTINEWKKQNDKIILNEDELKTKIDKLKNTSVNVLTLNEYNDFKGMIVYRGFSDESHIDLFIKKPKFASTMFGTGIYTSKDYQHAKMYGSMLEMKIDISNLIEMNSLLKIIIDKLSLVSDKKYALKLYNEYYKDIGLAAIGLNYSGVIKDDNVILIVDPSCIYINNN